MTTVILLGYAEGRYRPGWNGRQAKRVLRFGMPLVGATVLGFSIQNVDSSSLAECWVPFVGLL